MKQQKKETGNGIWKFDKQEWTAWLFIIIGLMLLFIPETKSVAPVILGFGIGLLLRGIFRNG